MTGTTNVVRVPWPVPTAGWGESGESGGGGGRRRSSQVVRGSFKILIMTFILLLVCGSSSRKRRERTMQLRSLKHCLFDFLFCWIPLVSPPKYRYTHTISHISDCHIHPTTLPSLHIPLPASSGSQDRAKMHPVTPLCAHFVHWPPQETHSIVSFVTYLNNHWISEEYGCVTHTHTAVVGDASKLGIRGRTRLEKNQDITNAKYQMRFLSLEYFLIVGSFHRAEWQWLKNCNFNVTQPPRNSYFCWLMNLSNACRRSSLNGGRDICRWIFAICIWKLWTT